MAYAANNLALQYDGGGGAGRRYRYITTDSVATILVAAYFDSAVDILDIGDMIDVSVVDIVNIGTRTALTGTVRLVVTAQTATAVTVALMDAPVAVTAATLAVTHAAHHLKTVSLDRAAGITVTLPAATGSGLKLRFYTKTTITSNNHIIQVTTDDVMKGTVWVASDNAADAAIAFETAVDSDTITMNGSTKGGLIGDLILLEDIAADTWSLQAFLQGTGTEVTPLSAAVT